MKKKKKKKLKTGNSYPHKRMSEKEEGSSPSGQRNIENPGYVYFSLPVAAQLTERGFVNSVK